MLLFKNKIKKKKKGKEEGHPAWLWFKTFPVTFFLKEKCNKDGLVNLWQLQLIEQVSGKS